MVFADRRDVHRADSVLLKSHALVVEAAQDRAIGARSKGRARDARLLAQRRAKRRAASLRQLRLVEPVDAGARSKIFLKPRREKRRRSTHHDFGQLLLRMGLAASERRGRQRAGDNHETLNRHWHALSLNVIVLHMLVSVGCAGMQRQAGPFVHKVFTGSTKAALASDGEVSDEARTCRQGLAAR